MEEIKTTMSSPLLTPSASVYKYVWCRQFFWEAGKGTDKAARGEGTCQGPPPSPRCFPLSRLVPHETSFHMLFFSLLTRQLYILFYSY